MPTSKEEANRIIKKVGEAPGKFIDVNLTVSRDGPLIKQMIKEGFLYSRSDQGYGDDHRIYLSGVGEVLYEQTEQE